MLTKYEFHKVLGELLNNWKGRDQLIFYFTGHGKIINDTFCIQVGPSNDDFVPFDNLLNEFNIKGVRRSIIILDTCHSGAATGIKSSERLPPLKQYTLPQGTAILASSRHSESSLELPDGSSSIFTHLFCKGIESSLGGKKTSDGHITIEDLLDYVKCQLDSDKQYADVLQRPVYRVDQADRSIWISKNPNGKSIDHTESEKFHKVFSYEDLRVLYENTISDKHPILLANSIHTGTGRKAAKRETLVCARFLPVNQPSSLAKLMAAAVKTCCKCVLANPI